MKKLITNSLRSLLFVVLPLAFSGVGAQSLTGINWYFGNSPQGVSFSRSSKTPSLVATQAMPFGTGGSAVASSSINGDLLFYSDGVNIYDASNQPMPNGTGLGGNPAGNQAVAVAKVPGQDNQYYVFVNSANGGTGGSVSYRIVDMSLPGNAVFPNPIPLGASMASTNTALTGLNNTAESMLVVPQQGTENFWLITHDDGTATYTVTLFTPAGPQPPTTYNVGVITQPGNLAYHAATKKIAVSPQEANRNVEILNFDPLTGALTFNMDVPNSAVATVTSGSAVYDTEWSFSGNYLYISSEGEPGVPGNVMQFDLGAPTNTMQSVLPQPNTIYQSYGLQMGPDSVIYHLYQATPGGPFLMGSIADTDSVAANVVYTPKVFPGNVNFGGTQFPSFAPPDTTNLTVTFTTNGNCANAPTGFFPTVSPGADSLRWAFGDGSGSSDWSPVYTYTQGGSYQVSVTAYLNGQSTVATPQTVTITDFDTQINLVQDTTACSCELPFPKAPNPPPQCGQFTVKAQMQGSGNPTLQWYGPGGLIPGATTATLQPDSAGYYYLVATVGTCATYAGVNIKEYGEEDQRANIWYFGDKAGIDFNPQPPKPPVAITNPVMNAPEGTSTISDRNGQVVFFTDGDKVWNRTFQEIATGIGGDPASGQSALIIPVAGDETLYYIFTTKAVYGDGSFEVRYSLFDLKMNGGTGGLIQQDVLLFARSTEKLTGNANWLIAHEYGNNSFRAYPISNLGIGNPVISAIGSDHATTSAANGQGYMKLGPQDRLAVALSTPGKSNVVEVFDFDNTTGKITNFRTANTNIANAQLYGVEFSSGGNKLYATLQNQGGGSEIVEFAFDSLANPYLKKPSPMQNSTVPEKLGAIQIGPDGQIYVAVDGQQYLGTIQPAEDTTQLSVYTANGFALLGGTKSNQGLPNFIQHLADPIQGPFMTIAGQCVLDSTMFAGTPTDPIDKFFWQVRLGASTITTSTAQQFNYLFTTPGLYDVSLRLTNRCGLDTTLVQQLRIYDLPPDPTASAVMCTGSVVLDANPTNLPGLSYVWSTGDSTETITVNRRGYYNVTVTNTAGCSVDGRILAADNRPVVDLGENQTICQNTPVPVLDALNPGATYVWTRNGVAIPGGTRRTQAVSTSTAGPPTFEYEVTVTDPVTTCFTKDSVVFTINALPIISTPVANSIACGAATGTIDLNITAPASALFTYSITGPSTSITDSDLTVGPIPQATGLAAGTYSITVADQVTTCAVTTAATINNNNFTVSGLQDVTCDPINLNVTIAPVGPPSASYTWRVIDTSLPLPPAGQGVQTGSTTLVAFNTSSATSGPIGLPSNNEQYIVEIKDINNCISSSAPIAVNHNPKVPALFDINCDPVAPVSITASQGTSFAWTGPAIVSGAATANMKANPPAGTQQYAVNIKQAGFCDLDTTLSVVVQPPILAAISQDDACSDLVTITATPNGNFLYRWFVNNTLQPSLGGPQVFANLSNDGQQFSVSIFSTVTGCESTSNGLVVQVDDKLTVTLASTTPCEGSPFTLTATPSRTATFAWAMDGSTIPGQTAATLVEQRAGLYRVTASAATCKATADLDITLASPTPGLLNNEAVICADPANPDPNTRSVVLRPGEFASYDWMKDNVSLGINTPTLTADEPGLYSVLLTNAFGCNSSDKTNVTQECDPVIVGPNAFRPTSSVVGIEGDMVNQSFHLYTFFIDDEDFEVFIFNRWGEMIFQSGQRDFRWNGGYKNNLAQLSPAGSYSYLVRYKSSYRPEKGIMEKRGGVLLMR